MDKKDRHLRLSDLDEETFVTASGLRLHKSPIRDYPVDIVRDAQKEDQKKARKVQKLIDDIEDLRAAVKREKRLRITVWSFTVSMIFLTISASIALTVASTFGYNAGSYSGFLIVIPFIFTVVGGIFTGVIEDMVIQNGNSAADLKRKEREYRDFFLYET